MDVSVVETTVTEASQAHEPGAVPTLTAAVKSALRLAIADQSAIDPEIFKMLGMSGKRYRCFINNLIGSLPDARYLEVGSWAGSTLCSAINRNAVRATAIDNWSQFGGPKGTFLANLETFRTPRAYVNFIESDFRAVDYASLGKFNVYLFDGPHEKIDQYDGLHLATPALDDTFIFIVDDWNWTAVREGTFEAIEACGYTAHYQVELRTTLDGSHATVHGQASDWHNGYYIAVLSKA